MGPFLVSPTEPLAFRRLGPVSPVPERFGADVAWSCDGGFVGVQRKTLADLVVSMRDGRLAASAVRMRALRVAVLLIEGRLRWSAGGRLATVRSSLSSSGGVDRRVLRGLVLSAQLAGLWVVHSDDVVDSLDTIVHLRAHLSKPQHTAFSTRGPPGDDWRVRVLQCFPSVGPGSARAIISHFGGLPLAWTVDAPSLAAVPGIGPKRAAALIDGLTPRAAAASSSSS